MATMKSGNRKAKKSSTSPHPYVTTDALTSRQQADRYLDGGMVDLIAAFNLTDDLTGARPWVFPTPTRNKAEQLLRELYALFQQGGFKPRAGSLAQSDVPFQRFMQETLSETRICRTSRTAVRPRACKTRIV